MTQATLRGARELCDRWRERAERAEAALREWQLGVGDTEMEAENKRLRAELDNVKAEWAVAMRDIVSLQAAARALGERGGSANTPAQRAQRAQPKPGAGRPPKRKAEIDALTASIPGLANDARYWDLRRTYGDYSAEVLGHLRACDAYQRSVR